MLSFRPDTFDKIIGQTKAIQQLDISIKSAKQRNEPLAHCLFTGVPGIGKTTLARAVANEMGVEILIGNGANIGSLKQILPYVMKLKEGDILFIDEIHRLALQTQEFLFPVMEDFRVDLSDGKTTESIEVPKFTFMGATTEGGSLLAPLRDRFVAKIQLSLYNNKDLYDILQINKERVELNISDNALMSVAKRARGTPRIANNYLL